MASTLLPYLHQLLFETVLAGFSLCYHVVAFHHYNSMKCCSTGESHQRELAVAAADDAAAAN